MASTPAMEKHVIAMTKSKHAGCIQGFHHLAEAWYAVPRRDGLPRDEYTDEIELGFYDPEDGGTTGAFTLRWYDVANVSTPRLEAFCDSWDALAHVPDVLELLSALDGVDVPPLEFCRMLVARGFTDLTKRERGG